MYPTIEPRFEGLHKISPDISAAGADSDTNYFDVTLVSPLAPFHLTMRTSRPLTSVKAARAEKLRKYKGFISRLSGSDNLVPVPISMFGG